MTHEEYWKSRIDNVFDSNYHKNELKKMYIKAYAENEKQILKLYDELKKKGRLTTTQLYRIDRFMSLRKALAKQAEQVNSELNERMTQDLTNAYRETFGECVRELGLDMTWSMQNEKMLNKVLNTKWAGSNYSKRIWNNSQQLPKDVEAAVVDCLTRGTSKDVYVKAIKNKYNVGFSKADRLVRTELSHTINEGQRDIYKSYGFKKVKWYAAEDERMCKLCGSMHEKIYDIDDVPSVAHANCRCTFSPVAESLETGGKSVKTVDNSAKSDIIDNVNQKQGEQGVHYIGKIDRNIYKCVTEDIRTDEVIISDTQIQHIKDRHPNDYENYFKYAETIIANPDYILEANKPNTAFILKHIEDDNKSFEMILRLQTSNDINDYKNSVITFLKVEEKRYNRYLRTKKILYKSE